MLTEPERILIARGLDGLPEKAERKQLRVLLRSSHEARQFYRDLARERQQISHLPRHNAPASVYRSVMARVESHSPFATIPSSSRPGPGVRRPLLHTAIAASVVFAVSATALWLKHASEQRAVVRNQVQALPRVDDTAVILPDEPIVVVSRIPEDIDPLESTLPAILPEVTPKPKAIPGKPRVVLGAPPMPVLIPEMIQARLPLIVSMKEVSTKATQKKITGELGRGTPARVDLFCHDTLKAADLIVATGRAVGINVVLEASAKQRLRQHVPTSWVVYTESLTPDEATKWLARLAASSDTVFQAIHLPAPADQDARDLRELMGLDFIKPAKSASNAAKTTSSSTADPAKSASTKEKPAIMLSYLPPQARVNPANSPSLKTWLERRKEPRPGTIRLMLVVR